MEKEKFAVEVSEIITRQERVNEKIYGNMKIENVVGDIIMRDCQVEGDLLLSSSTGNIILSNCRVQNLQVRTGQGDICLHHFTISKEKEAFVQTNSGNVTLDHVLGHHLSLTAYRSMVLLNTVTLEKLNFHIENGDVLLHKVKLLSETDPSVIEISSGDCTLSATQYQSLSVRGLVTDLYTTEKSVRQKKLTFETKVGSRRGIPISKNEKE